MEDLCSFLCSCWVVQKGDVYLSQGGEGEDVGPDSMADGVGQSTAPMAAAWEAPVVWWAEGQLAHLQVASSTKAAVCQRRGLWAQPLPSFHVVVLLLELCHHSQRCCGAAATPGSVGAGLSVLPIPPELWGVATGNQFFALNTMFR